MSKPGYIKPPWAARVIGGRMARLFKPSVVNLLTVRGRRTGRPARVPVAVLAHEGQEYLMAAYGHTEWSRNLRAAGTARLDRRGRSDQITVEPVPVEELPPLIAEYLRQFGGMPGVAKTFQALPDPGDHPTFRITAATPAGGR